MRGSVFAAALVVAGAAADAHAFAFLCNGIDAEGNQESDGCGPCDGDTAARWDELQVDFSFDDTVRPPEVTLAEWQANQTATIANWNNVSGQALTIRDIGAAQVREFGEINGENSIFWITSRNQFIQQVNGDPNSILGVTLAPTGGRCDQGNGRRDGIIDADLVMNGTGSFDWDETSVVSTMTHEMGHAIGFGHPCVDCVDRSIMSATGGGPDDSEVPLFDDQEAIRALYPGSPGGVGTACDSDGDCDDNTCVTVQISGVDRSFCTQSCGSCPGGMVCSAVAGEGNVCVFSNAGIAGVGEQCGPPGCADECVNFDVDAGCNVCLDTCFAGCRTGTNQGCQDGETCVSFACNADNQCFSGDCGANGVCNDPVGVCLSGSAGTTPRGGACADPSECQADLACVTDQNGNNGVCFGLCNANGGGCLQTENCLFLFNTADQGVCLPAGVGQEGDACTGFDDCARGLFCTGVCEQRCDRGFTCGDDTQTCTPTGTNGMSTCRPVGSEGEGEEGEGEEGEGEGAECDVSRGNFDCPAGRSCDDGSCVNGEGPVGTFSLCDKDADCSGGICQNGVCTRPCDVAANGAPDGCPGGYTCQSEDDTGVTGGLCVADSCAADDSICDDGFTCAFSSAQRNVCAKGVPAKVCGCAADGASTPSAAVVVVAAALGLRRRRRRA